MKRRTFCQTTLKQAAVQELSDELRGPLLLPGNPAYDSGRHVLNAAIDKYPAFIVQPGNLIYPIDRLRDILEFYAEFSVNAPDELAADLIFGYPQGRPGFVVLALCYCGDHAEGTRVMAAVKALGEPMMGEIKPTDYVALQRSGDSDAPRATASYLKGGFITGFNQKLVDTIVDGMNSHPDRSSMMIFQQGGGAIKRIPTDATAFAHRYSENNMIATMGWKPGSPGAEHVRAIKSYWATLMPIYGPGKRAGLIGLNQPIRCSAQILLPEGSRK